MAIQVVVTGVGGHGYEVEVIRRALEAAGVIVHMGDGTNLSLKDWSIDPDLVANELSRMKEKGITRGLTIRSVHIPWGG